METPNSPPDTNAQRIERLRRRLWLAAPLGVDRLLRRRASDARRLELVAAVAIDVFDRLDELETAVLQLGGTLTSGFTLTPDNCVSCEVRREDPDQPPAALCPRHELELENGAAS
jgi:hypothetical protein